MRIALLDSFPNLDSKAELEFIARFGIAASHLGLETATVITSDDIADYGPDLVLATHEYSRKLTKVPTVGLIWSPLKFFRDDAYRVRSIASLDGYLVGSEQARRYVEDLQFGVGIEKPIGRDSFLPTACLSTDRAFPRGASADLCYVGVHWDGKRHHNLLAAIAADLPITFYGPPASWRHLDRHYAGPLPFDGRSVQRAIAKHGIALCLHKPDHRNENMPSMRIFESLSVGAVVICDRIPFAVEHLGDIAYFIDVDDEPGAVVAQVRAVLERVNADPAEAADRGERGRRWFEAHWSLEARIRDVLLPLHERVIAAGHFAPARVAPKRRRWLPGRAAPIAPAVEVVIRSGHREIEVVTRALDSIVAAQSAECPLGVVLVDYAGRPELARLAETHAGTGVPVRYVRSATTGLRSTALWDGLRAARAALVAHLDDDDTVFPNHYRQLRATLDRTPQANVAYSGVLRFEEEGEYTAAPNFDGPQKRVIPERRDIQFLDPFNLARLARLDNFIQSNTWMARRGFLQPLLGEDPGLQVSEDVYLYLLMARHGPFAFTGSATAMWHWRSRSRDNSMLSVSGPIWLETARRIRDRFRILPFAGGLPLAHLALLGAGEQPVGASPESLPPIEMDTVLAGGTAIARRIMLTGFHQPEDAGIWSSAPVAWIDLNPSPDVQRSGAVLILRFVPACGPQAVKWFGAEMEGGPRVQSLYSTWDEQELRFPIAPDHVGGVRVTLRIGELLKGGVISDDMRDIGLYLKHVEVRPVPA